MKRYANFFAAILLLMVGNGATAATSTLNSPLSFNAQNIAAFNHLITPGFTNFNDLFTFTTSSASGGASAIASFNGLSFSTGFSAFNLLDVTHGNAIIATGSLFGPNIVSQLSFSGLNANTIYGLNVAGTVADPTVGGYYSGSVTVSPVPEFEEYVLMLSGLALIGFIATRRSPKQDFSAA